MGGRKDIRERYSVDGGCCTDWYAHRYSCPSNFINDLPKYSMVSTCCVPCALAQEAQELKAEEEMFMPKVRGTSRSFFLRIGAHTFVWSLGMMMCCLVHLLRARWDSCCILWINCTLLAGHLSLSLATAFLQTSKPKLSVMRPLLYALIMDF